MTDGQPDLPRFFRRPRIIPVLDVMGGVVVRAVGGRRAEYRPNLSGLIADDDISAVARALGEAAGTQELYVADLDAIGDDGRPTFAVADFLARRPRDADTWVDFGLRDPRWYRDNPFVPGVRPVLAFETGVTAEAVRQLARQHLWAEPAFSIDLRGGRLVGDWRGWGLADAADAVGLADRVCGIGIGSLIVLDLERVGVGCGTGTGAICAAIRSRHPHITIITGGGVGTWDDVEKLGEYGIDGVLVATALHDRSITSRG